MLRNDPKAFMAIVRNHNPRDRVYGLHTFDDMMACEFLRYGIFNDFSTVPELTQLYDTVFMEAPAERRQEIYGHVEMIVSALGGATVGSFTPFMNLDDDKAIVSTATIDYVSMGSLRDDDPMFRPKDVIEMVRNGVPRNPGAVAGGLLTLGDPRVCELVAPVARQLEPLQVRTMTQCFSGFTAKPTVEFYLDWLDELVGLRESEGDGLIGELVAGLYRLADLRVVPFVFDGLRPFPAPKGQVAEYWPGVARINPDEFARAIAGRLYDLEERERAPKLIPHAIRAFGLVPKTPFEDTGLMQ
jgi:hypothetical protein